MSMKEKLQRVKKMIEQDFGPGKELLPRALTQRFLRVALGEAFAGVGRLEAIRAIFEEEFRRGLLREEDFIAEPKPPLVSEGSLPPLIPLNEESEADLEGVTYKIYGVPAYDQEHRPRYIRRLSPRAGGVFDDRKILNYIFLMGQIQLTAQGKTVVVPYEKGTYEELSIGRGLYSVGQGLGLGWGRPSFQGLGLRWGRPSFKWDGPYPRFEYLKVERPELFFHCFTPHDILEIFSHWKSSVELQHLAEWAAALQPAYLWQIVDYINLYGARRIRLYLLRSLAVFPHPDAEHIEAVFAFLIGIADAELELVGIEEMGEVPDP
jgi:hypothetical protein